MKNTTRKPTTPRRPTRTDTLDARLKAIPGLRAAVRKQILAVLARPRDNADALKWCAEQDEAYYAASKALRKLAGIVRVDVKRIDRKVVAWAQRYGWHAQRLEHGHSLTDTLAAVQVAAIRVRAEAPTRNGGRPKERENQADAYRIAEVFSRAGLSVNSTPKSIFGQVVKAVVFPRGVGDAGRYLKHFANWNE
jgi:hypothetical protein